MHEGKPFMEYLLSSLMIVVSHDKFNNLYGLLIKARYDLRLPSATPSLYGRLAPDTIQGQKINQSVSQSISQSCHYRRSIVPIQSINNQSINQSIIQSINQSINLNQ